MPVHDEDTKLDRVERFKESARRAALAPLLAVFPPAGGTDAASLRSAVDAHMVVSAGVSVDVYAAACNAILAVWDQRTLPPPSRILRACREVEHARRAAERALTKQRTEEAERAAAMTPEQARELLRSMPECDAPAGSLAHTLNRVGRSILLKVIAGGDDR